MLANNPHPVKQVSEGLFDFLLNETVLAIYQFPQSLLLSDSSSTDNRSLKNHVDMESGFYKMENLAFEVGQRLIESLTLDRPRFIDTLDIMKYICKDFWTYLYGKGIDNLKTNHRGIYVLNDNNFKIFKNMSSNAGVNETAKEAIPFLAFPCGLIRGALFALGVTSSVSAEIISVPQCLFQVKILPS